MKQLKAFIKENLQSFSNLSNSETYEYKVKHISKDIVNYLKSNHRFDYGGICVYYVSASNEVWVENILA